MVEDITSEMRNRSYLLKGCTKGIEFQKKDKWFGKRVYTVYVSPRFYFRFKKKIMMDACLL